MIWLLAAMTVAQGIVIWALTGLWGDARHRLSLTQARVAKLEGRLARHRHGQRPRVHVTAVLPPVLPALPAPLPAEAARPRMGELAALGCGDGWPSPPTPRRPRDVIDAVAHTQQVPVIPVAGQFDGDGIRGPLPREEWAPVLRWRSPRVPAGLTVTRVRVARACRGVRVGWWWLAARWPGAVEAPT